MDQVLQMTLESRPRVRLLGGFAIRDGRSCGEPFADHLPLGVQRLVAHLCLVGRQARTAVAGRLWPDVPEEKAHASLRSALWRLRRALPELVDATGDALGLAAGVRVDVRDLHTWADRVEHPRAGTDRLMLPDMALLADLLPGWYDDWVLLERDRLQQLRLHALETLAARLGVAGRHGDALQVAHLAIRSEPLRESAHRTVVGVHIAEGNVVEALRAYARFRDLLHAELGVPPTEQMTRLVQSITGMRRAAS
jgi:DNA-binding SARP family transcriptional activator